ncbi:uncharacterized protein KZ484_022109 [Pholidichthys leucotaenia]
MTDSASSNGCRDFSAEGSLLGDLEYHLDVFPDPFLFTSFPVEANEEELQKDNGSSSKDGDLKGLEKRWILWHEFMKDHAHLDSWLQLAEQAITSPSLVQVTYVRAKEELQRFERLRREAGSRLVQLDSLTRRNRNLTRMFQGAMQARLLALVRECGRRWDNVSAKLESITGQLQLLVSEWEEFEAQRVELSLMLADMDVRLSEVDHLTGNSCEKLRRLQSFQQCVCINSGHVNALLQRGESLMQRCDSADAQQVERHLLETLRHCKLVYNNIARTHTRMISMRLVFEDDWILSQTSDSGCPSESLLEDEGDKDNQQMSSMFSKSAKVLRSSGKSPPPPSSSPTHDPLGLEWDPSVDIGRSVSRDDADSSYFSAGTGLGQRNGRKRWSYLSFDSQSDISADITNQEEEGLEEWLHHSDPRFFSPVSAHREDRWTSSTPDLQDGQTTDFDRGWVKAWLQVQSSAPSQTNTSCSKSVQTDEEVADRERCDDGGLNLSNQLHPRLSDDLRCHDNDLRCHDNDLRCHDSRTPPVTSESESHDLNMKASDWVTHESDEQREEESPFCEEVDQLPSEQSLPSCTSPSSPSSYLSSLLLLLLLFAFFLAALTFVLLEPPCYRSNRLPHSSFHLELRYVNGPPPT